MPRDYKNTAWKKPVPLTERFGHVPYFFVGLSIGLFVAVIVYFHEHNSAIKINNALLSSESSEAAAYEESEVDDTRVTDLPEPQFDFYKILPNREVNISEWESVEDEKQDPGTQAPVMFVLQAGSFKQYGAADEIKAKLALMGVEADIQRVVINGQDVRHRVRIGPYKNSTELRQVREHLLANDLDFVLLKLKMEDI